MTAERADPVLALLAAAADASGSRAWVVGGYVRDRLLGRMRGAPEVDVVVEDGRGHELAAEFARLSGSPPPVLFERFGTAHVTWGERSVEFASARVESYAPESRRPDVRPATLEEDLRRRDFTVNALLMDFEGNVHDRLGGALEDLRQGVLRTPLDPLTTFSDDPLRMLRAIRFAAQLDFRLDPALLPAMAGLQARLSPPVVSVERIGDEVRKMLLAERPRRALELLDEGSLLPVILPELSATKGVEQGGFHRFDVFGHTLRVVEATPPDLVTRLAAVFHDVGKPQTARPDGTFLGHEKAGEVMAAAALGRLRFPNLLVARVARLVRMHLRPVFYEPDWSDGAVRRLVRDAGPDLWRLMDLGRADIGASAYDRPEKLEELAERLRRVTVEEPERLLPTISGEDIMRVLGIPPGPRVGRIKKNLEELVLDGHLDPAAESVLRYLTDHPDL